MIPIDSCGYFITGSDTDVGKTYIACEIVRQLRRQNIRVETRKPVESGCDLSASGDLLTHDALALQRSNNNLETIDAIAAYQFQAALAPHRAARLEGQQLSIEKLLQACTRKEASGCMLVEGAGGFFSPIAENGLNADLASALQMTTVIVVNDRIGAVNQALMTILAVESRHLPIAAVILNQVLAGNDPHMDNAVDLQRQCHYPVFCCAHNAPLADLFFC